MLVVAASSVHAYPLTFSDLTCHLWGYRNRCFLVALYHLIVRKPNLEVATSPSAGKNTRIVSVPCCAWKSVPTAIWGICSNFVECEWFLESNLPDILTLCETNLDDWPEQVFRENILPMFLRFSWQGFSKILSQKIKWREKYWIFSKFFKHHRVTRMRIFSISMSYLVKLNIKRNFR